MHSILLAIDACTRRHRRLVVGAWMAVLAAAIPFAMRESEHLTAGGFVIPGSQSAAASAVLARDFPDVSRASLAVLLWPRSGATTAELKAGVERVERAVGRTSDVGLAPWERTLAILEAGTLEPVVMPLEVNGDEDRAQRAATRLRDRLGLNGSGPASGSVEVHLLGEGALAAGLDHTFKAELVEAEEIGLPILLVVLLAIFGSLATAALPLVVGVVAVLVTGALIYLLSLAMDMSVYVTNTASMLGIGVAVDYSLIVLARVRQELRAGRSLAQARRVALTTSGRAVVFSGMVVVGSLAGLWTVPSAALRSMAIGAMLVVAVSVLVSVTLLPVLIDALGVRRVSGRPVLAAHLSWTGWAERVMRRPVAAVAISAALLAILCVPALDMRTSLGALRQLGPGNETRIGFSEAERIAGRGALGPVYVVVRAPGREPAPQLRRWSAHLRGVAGSLRLVQRLGVTHVSGDTRSAFFTVIPAVDPESPAAKGLVERLRARLRRALAAPGAQVVVGGASATQLDEQRGIAASMWKVIAAVLCVALLAMIVLFRSLVLPVAMVVTNLASVAAAYGVLVTVFQWGWLDSLLGYRSLGSVNTLTLPLVLAVAFGLSMDYEVFLLSRIRERWLSSGDSRAAVAEGLATSARTISSAALILVSVFAIFVGTGIPSVKELGLGAAVAVGIDATLIRLVLVPATMGLLGDWSWWLPGPLERLLSLVPVTRR